MLRIIIKNNATIEEYIKITNNIDNTCILYSYVKISSKSNECKSKHTFNKFAFIEYLNSIQLPKKYIKEVEKYESD